MGKATSSGGSDKRNDDDVPAKMRPKFEAVWSLVEPFRRERLSGEYAKVCRRALVTLARKRPSPLVNGTAKGWAAGVVRAIGQANFLGDPSQLPHATTAEVDRAFGVSQATGAAKSKAVRELLKISPLGFDWILPSRLADHPLARMVAVDGLIMDVGQAPPGTQQEALERGLIPPLPGRSVRPAGPTWSGRPRLYTLDVYLIEGLISEAFAKRNPVVSRTLQVRGDQTLQQLHEAIFDAFDREDEHMYEFQFGKGPNDLDGPRYGLPSATALDAGRDNPMAGTVDVTTLDALGLTVGRAFGYWFDFGDDWWHQINVVAIDAEVRDGPFPRVTARVGQSPPQYPDDLG